MLRKIILAALLFLILPLGMADAYRGGGVRVYGRFYGPYGYYGGFYPGYPGYYYPYYPYAVPPVIVTPGPYVPPPVVVPAPGYAPAPSYTPTPGPSSPTPPYPQPYSR
jgi:hypothetical protein